MHYIITKGGWCPNWCPTSRGYIVARSPSQTVLEGIWSRGWASGRRHVPRHISSAAAPLSWATTCLRTSLSAISRGGRLPLHRGLRSSLHELHKTVPQEAVRPPGSARWRPGRRCRRLKNDRRQGEHHGHQLTRPLAAGAAILISLRCPALSAGAHLHCYLAARPCGVQDFRNPRQCFFRLPSALPAGAASLGAAVEVRQRSGAPGAVDLPQLGAERGSPHIYPNPQTPAGCAVHG